VVMRKSTGAGVPSLSTYERGRSYMVETKELEVRHGIGLLSKGPSGWELLPVDARRWATSRRNRRTR